MKDSIKHSYKQYEGPLEYKEYVELLYRFFKFVMGKILKGESIKMPSKLGDFFVIGKKHEISFDEKGNVKGLQPNWGETRKLWAECPECKEKKQLIFHTNEHTNGIRYKYHWKKSKTYLGFIRMYYFIPSWSNKRELARLIKNGKEYYIDSKKYK